MTTKLMTDTKKIPTGQERSVTPADLAGPASPGRDQWQPATDKTFMALETRLVGSLVATDRLAAAGGRQVSAVFVSFVVPAFAPGPQVRPA
jgi:hypothetical protein